MKNKVILIEMLFDKIEEYGRTSIALYKLKTIDKVTDVFASLSSRIVVAIIITLLIIFLSFGASFYLGELLGKIYYGFFAVTGFYAFVAILLLICRKSVENTFNDYIINQIFKEKENANNNQQ
ncbi:MAG: hypothetical protein V4548_00095 [Bacteroidota bacterium]